MIHIKPKQYGVFKIADKEYVGYIALYYTFLARRTVMKVLSAREDTVPDEGYILYTKEGTMTAIPDAVQEYRQIRIKTELRKAFEDISKCLDEIITSQARYDNQIQALRESLANQLKTKEKLFQRQSIELRGFKQDLQAVARNKISLSYLSRVLRESKVTTKVSNKPSIFIEDMSICIESHASLQDRCDKASAEALKDQWLTEARRRFEVDCDGFPKHIGRYRVTLEDDIQIANNIIYTHHIRIHYPKSLSNDDIKATLATARVLGLIART